MNKERKQWMEFLLLSCIIHFIVLFFVFSGRVSYEDALDPDSYKGEAVDVDVIGSGEIYRQIIGLDDDYKGDEEYNETARYLGKVNRRVQEETRARAWGAPKNRKSRVQYIVQQDMDDIVGTYLKGKRPSKNKGNSGGSTDTDEYGESTTYDYLPDVRIGDDTILNTAQFIYFTFYRRVEERVVYLWNNYVTEFIRSRPDVAENLSKRDYVTDVEAVLDKEGNFIRMQIIRSAGVTGLDQAPEQAFAVASPFVNPPEGMVEEDGLIKMRWRFIVGIVGSMKFKIQEIDNPFQNRGYPDPNHEKHIR